MRSEPLSQGGGFRIISTVIIILATLRASCHELPSQLTLRLEELPEFISTENHLVYCHICAFFQVATQDSNHNIYIYIYIYIYIALRKKIYNRYYSERLLKPTLKPDDVTYSRSISANIALIQKHMKEQE